MYVSADIWAVDAGLLRSSVCAENARGEGLRSKAGITTGSGDVYLIGPSLSLAVPFVCGCDLDEPDVFLVVWVPSFLSLLFLDRTDLDDDAFFAWVRSSIEKMRSGDPKACRNLSAQATNCLFCSSILADADSSRSLRLSSGVRGILMGDPSRAP